MYLKAIYILLTLSVLTLTLTLPATSKADDLDHAEMIELSEQFWRSGQTLPIEFSRVFKHDPQQLRAEDTGINVLVDLAHQCSFATMWGLTSNLRSQGYRAVGSHELLDKVLVPGTTVRTRLPIGDYRPFAWWPVKEFNVVFSSQDSSEYQRYTEQELAVLEQWIRDGGGLIIATHAKPNDQDELSSQHAMLERWGVKVSDKRIDLRKESGLSRHRGVVLEELSDDWEVIYEVDGNILAARRPLGKGRIVIIEDPNVLCRIDRIEDEKIQAKAIERFHQTFQWAAGGKAPVGGTTRLPISGFGAGGITPGNEVHVGNIVIFYADNQLPELIDVYTNVLPKAKQKVYEMLPTPPHKQPMYIIAASGGGGGWAVNAFEPRENGVISMNPAGIVSIFGHEIAHTMAGPYGAAGVHAGRSPHRNRGEAHAGWFQGKINAWFDPEKYAGKPNRNANSILELKDKKGRLLDLKTEFENEQLRENWGKGREWQKLWYIWQKLDDRYGTTWYPRWCYVRNTRWADVEAAEGGDDDYDLTWEQTVEDMSIAVGEDLFPFFIKLGTSLDRQAIGPVEFKGETLHLKPAPLERTPAGPVRMELPGDYTKPLQSTSP